MRPRTRRMFLTDLGRTTAGLLVVGGGLVACGEDDPVVSASPSAAPTSLTTSLVDLGFVAAYVLAREGQAAVVDTGVEGSEGDILTVLEAAGLGWDAVSDLILTHSHPDHAGSLPAVSAAAASATIHAGEADIPNMQAGRDISPVTDGDTVFGLQVIATPGHTPGHISVYDPSGRTLITGDALIGDEEGGLAGPPPEFTEDMDQAIASVAKLAGFDVAEVLVHHGFPATAGSAELQALADALGA